MRISHVFALGMISFAGITNGFFSLNVQASDNTGRFCNVQTPGGGWWLWVTGDMTSDPCQVLLTQHCTGPECRVVNRTEKTHLRGFNDFIKPA